MPCDERSSARAPTPSPSSSWAPARRASPPPPCSASTASSASSWTAGTAVYPQPRAVHLDDEIYRILARLGIAEQFAAVSRPIRGLQLIDRNHRVLAVFDRAGDHGRHGYPEANMFDQPELEHLLRTNLKDQTTVSLRGNVEVTDVAQDGQGRVRVDFTDRLTGEHESVLATYVLGCDGANSVVRAAIGATMQDLKFEQRWLVIDVASRRRARPVGGRAPGLRPRPGRRRTCGSATTRYRWEFRLLDRRDRRRLRVHRALLSRSSARGSRTSPATSWSWCASRSTPSGRSWPTAGGTGNVFLLGDAAHLTPPFIGQGLCAGVRDAMNLSWKIAGVLAGDLPGAGARHLRDGAQATRPGPDPAGQAHRRRDDRGRPGRRPAPPR